MTTVNDRQVGGAHYKNLKYQPWDFIVDIDLPYLQGCVIKYISRWRHKNDPLRQIMDLRKAGHYLEKIFDNNVSWSQTKHDDIDSYYKFINQFNEIEQNIITLVLDNEIEQAIEIVNNKVETILSEHPGLEADRFMYKLNQ